MSITNNRDIKVIFADQLTLFSLLRILISYRSVEVIWSFDPVHPFMNRLLRFICITGMINPEIREVHYHIGQVRNDIGKSRFVELHSDCREICNKIMREHLVDNPLIDLIGSDWDKR